MESMEPMQPVQPVEPVQQPVKPVKAKKQRNPKKIIAIILAIIVLFAAIFSGIYVVTLNMRLNKIERESDYYESMFNYYNYLIESGQIVLEEGVTSSYDDFMQNNSSDGSQDYQVDSNVPNNSQSSSSSMSDDPSQWTTAQIVETYRHAAARTHNSVTSYQDMKMRDGSLNAPGIPAALLSFAEGVMADALAKNSMNIKGITGGHQNLVTSDVQSARAYKNGSNIVIEMVMKEQIDKGNGNMYSGTVGHAISVVGDIDNVIGQFSGLGMEATIADNDVTLHYKNPVVKVAINSSGMIINGTWSYYVDITLKNLTIKAMGMTVPVEQATSIVDFVVTLNGGFKG